MAGLGPVTLGGQGSEGSFPAQHQMQPKEPSFWRPLWYNKEQSSARRVRCVRYFHKVVMALLSPPSAGQRFPILVTGAHRAGTTWIGRTLSAGGEAAYINEPLSRIHRPGVFGAQVPQWYFYLCAENEAPFLEPFRQMLAFRYGWGRELRAVRSPRDVARMGRDGFRFVWARLKHQRPLLKDPFAVFSLPWFVARWGAQAVVVVRHPAAVVSSWLRLGWVVPPRALLRQPLLLNHVLTADEIAALESAQSAAPLVQAALLWRVIYRVVAEYRATEQAIVVRHEDLALAPVERFRTLYGALGLRFTPRVQRLIEKTTGGKAGETDPKHPHRVQLNSKAVTRAWRQRLAPEQIAHIRALTEPVASQFYTEADWA